ncbi:MULTISPECIES: TIGR03086 family metal-binding protein [unclassified Streptomyces]|uniref:TIGR03086 family metal-binding protein n=1 Tax=unclassified Streptomyces TaxID=2593676 RepID=UPI002E7A2442|nr:TIGR03086 family metal-binding protein [Streptomyces sp. JV176]MEE1803389.1 TIGR03086 family metal-binding protein [Streptomyces sp. JV176]
MDTDKKPEPLDLGPVCQETARVVGGVAEQHLSGVTPCPAYTVREVLAHLMGLTVGFRDAARKELGPTTDTAPGSAPLVLDEGWRETLPRRLDELAAAWRSPAAWDGRTRIGGVDLPGAVTGLVALNEVLIHGWDLARSTGQPYAPAEAGLRASYGMLSQAGPGASDVFGPPVPTAGDAPLLDRVIGLSGRRPDWRPGV